MNNALVATSLAPPQIDTMADFGKGVNDAQQAQSNKITIAQQAMSNIGSIAIASMGGKLDGQVDPQKFNQGLDLLQQHGMDVSSLRDHPEIAPVAARAAMTTLQQLAAAHDEQAANQAMQNFSLEIQKFQNTLSHQDNWQPLTDPAERAKAGIPANDSRAYEVNAGNGEIKAVGGAGQTINVGNDKIGTIPPNYAVDTDANGNVIGMHKIPGSPAEDQAAADAVTAAASKNLADTGANIVTTDAQRALAAIDKDPNWTTGMGALVTGFQPGSDAHDVQGFIDTMKSNASIDKLQQMRAASKTGGALGAVSDREDQMLADALGKLDPTQKADTFTYNIKRVFNIYRDIIDGADVGERYDLGKPGAPLSGPAKDTPKVTTGAGLPPADAEETKVVDGTTYWRIGTDWYH